MNRHQTTAAGMRSKKTISSRSRRKKDEVIEEPPPRKRVFLPDRSVLQIRVLSSDHKQLKEVVDQEVKSPDLKRRSTL